MAADFCPIGRFLGTKNTSGSSLTLGDFSLKVVLRIKGGFKEPGFGVSAAERLCDGGSKLDFSRDARGDLCK
jgi:hypothetical protein